MLSRTGLATTRTSALAGRESPLFDHIGGGFSIGTVFLEIYAETVRARLRRIAILPPRAKTPEQINRRVLGSGVTTVPPGKN